MTNEEFTRWIDAGQGRVDDKHTELRKLQIYDPDIKFQVKSKLTREWKDVYEVLWNLESEYRIKHGKCMKTKQ